MSSLGNIDGDSGHDAIAHVLTTDKNPEVVRAAIRETRNGGAVLNDALQSVLHDPDSTAENRQAAAERLDSLGALDDSDRHFLEVQETVD